MTASRLIQDERVKHLNIEDTRSGRYVLYWMQQSQRAHFNHALEYAVQRANGMGQRLVVGFGLTDDYPEANLRHYRFMLEGLRQTQASLAERGISMVVRRGWPDAVALELGAEASLIVCDRGYLRHQKLWRRRLAERAAVEVAQVESDVVVPVEVASDKAQWSARTLRPRIHRRLNEYLVELRPTPLKKDSLGLNIKGIDLADIDAALRPMRLDRSVKPVPLFKGGTGEGRRLLERFIDDLLDGYVANRNRPETDNVSHMSKYLHFGQISPLYVALRVRGARRKAAAARESYLEELIVRRELACNFVHFTDDYDSFTCLPAWARQTLQAHGRDKRANRYTEAQLDAAQTHDEYWNAAMRQMKHTGYMHNYMRMYWGKKILEWTATPRQAFRVALRLNNKYFIDGRDPNSYANVAWIFGLHDRPWKEREVFGKVRYMSAGGLQRKADPEAYVEKVNRLIRDAVEQEA